MNQFSDTGAVMPEGDFSPVEHDEATKVVLRALAEHGIKAVTTPDPAALKQESVLVDFEVKAGSMMHAQTLINMLLRGVTDGGLTDGVGVVGWWFAEDERYDGTDNDSAVFVPVGRQAAFQDFVREAIRRSLTPDPDHSGHRDPE